MSFRIVDIKNSHIVYIQRYLIKVANLNLNIIKELEFDDTPYNAFFNETNLYCCFSYHVEVFETKEWKKMGHIEIRFNEFTIFDVKGDYFIGCNRGDVFAYNFKVCGDFRYIGELYQQIMHDNIITCLVHYEHKTGKKILCAKYWDKKDSIIEAECETIIPFNSDEFLLLKEDYIEIVDWDGNLIKRYPLLVGDVKKSARFVLLWFSLMELQLKYLILYLGHLFIFRNTNPLIRLTKM